MLNRVREVAAVRVNMKSLVSITVQQRKRAAVLSHLVLTIVQKLLLKVLQLANKTIKYLIYLSHLTINSVISVITLTLTRQLWLQIDPNSLYLSFRQLRFNKTLNKLVFKIP
jgi:hypothetical protein